MQGTRSAGKEKERQGNGSQYLTQAAQIAQEQQAAAQAAAARSYTASNRYTTQNTQQGAGGGGSTGLNREAQQVRKW